MNIKIYSDKLSHYGKKTITKPQLEALFAESRDDVLFSVIETLRQSALLEPVLSSSTNGNRVYPIYLKYRITLPEETFEAELDEISRLHPGLQAGGILQARPGDYRKYRDRLQKLDRYLFSVRADRIPISRKERSFEIFGEEKFLDDSSFCRLLEKIGLGKEPLAYYDTPEYCFNDFIPERKAAMTLLICENKDIWFNIRRRMFEGHAMTLFDTRLDGVVYGSGNQISQKNALTAYTAFLGGGSISYLYWGDIDRAGLNIYLSLVKNNPALNISLFIPAYEKMLERARVLSIPDSEDLRERLGDYEQIFSCVSEQNQAYLRESILENKRIPQEIIPYDLLLQEMR